ncbi:MULTISPECIES: hypothetical protein [unclassified Rhizobium]|uniref:hypothetical protein n=1 Tax=unclassified Rhizobium TaxID=2613769 RepID=UPI0006FC5EC0|nr:MULTISPECIES: hypothetical protein [unclassified Rhizobium]KQV39910.1 hypothetical protein ASC86_21930 [Rhizobium sp. Root1212]KRD31620.1 hypothetical protein ASE37_22975 [Rhizobium sp. Root268]
MNAKGRREGASYKPLYHWQPTWPGEKGLHGKPRQDFVGIDREEFIGRIRLEIGGPMNGKWQWSGQGPHLRDRILPHQGYCDTAREASRMVEEYYHRLMRRNGLRGSKDVG